MTDLLPILLLAGCGAVLVLGFLALLAFGVLRHHAPKLMEILGGAGAMLGDGEPTPQVAAQQTYRRRRPNLREKAQSLDFDSALAHNQLDSQAAGRNPRAAPPWPAANTPSVTSQNAPQTSPPPLNADASSPLRRRRRDRNQDEIFANKLDEDGDEWMDF
jgi:hypothetical protein